MGNGYLRIELHVPSSPEAIEAVAEGLVGLNCWLLQQAHAQGMDIPNLYDSEIRYRREAPGEEWWESITDVMGVHGIGYGDCEDLAALRAAELRYYEGELARVRIGRTSRGSYHAIVQRADGTLEDPSRILVEKEQAEERAARRRRNRKG